MSRVGLGWAAALLLGATMLGGALWTGCGVKSEPIPPQLAMPERIVSLTATSEKPGIFLRWDRPQRYAGGSRMRDLGSFDVMRAGPTGDFHSVASIPVTDQQRFQQQRRFTYLDKGVKVGDTYRYQVVSETLDHYRSAPSNEVELKRTIPKPPPSPEHFVLPTPTPLP